MARATHLADTSAFSRLDKPHVAAVIGPLIAQGQVALCAPVAFELGFSARSAADHEAIMSRIDAFESAPHHRGLSLVDALVAAVAETRDLTILHYDADFELISEVTGQPTQWVVPPGTTGNLKTR